MIVWHWKDKNVHMLCLPTNAVFVGQNTRHLSYKKDAVEVSAFFIFSVAH